MEENGNILTCLKKAGIIAIVRAQSDDGLAEGATALVRGGITALEITLNTPNALHWIRTLSRELSEVAIGAGTILSAGDARGAIEAGAQFIVTPTLQLDSIAACRDLGAPIYCGAFTPTEALAAHNAGADFVKIFPATALGPGFVRDLLGPLPFLKLVPTGGVTAENAAAFIKAGAVAVGAGSALYNAQLAQDGRFDELEKRAAQWMAAVKTAGDRGGSGE